MTGPDVLSHAERAAREALTRPDDFGYYGDLPLFESWGFTFTQTRDSDALTRSNYRVALRELRELAAGMLSCPALPTTDRCASCGRQKSDVHPSDRWRWPHHLQPASADPDELVQEVHCTHWAYGWATHIAVQVLVDENGAATEDNLTPVFLRAAELAGALANYAVLDESDYSELESEEFDAYFTDEWGLFVRFWDVDEQGPEPTEEERDKVREAISNECGTSLDGWPDLAGLLTDVRRGNAS